MMSLSQSNEQKNEEVLLSGNQLKNVVIGSVAIGVCGGFFSIMIPGETPLDNFLSATVFVAIISFFFFGVMNSLMGYWHQQGKSH